MFPTEDFSNIFQMQYGGGLTKTKYKYNRLTADFFPATQEKFWTICNDKIIVSKGNFDLFKSTCLSESRDNVNYWILDFFWTSFRVLIYLCSNSLLIKVASLVSTVAYWTHVYQWSIMHISHKTGKHIIMGYVIKGSIEIPLTKKTIHAHVINYTLL